MILPCDYRQAVLKSIRFERPDFIPMTFSINAACWSAYPQEALFDLMESHPFLFPDFVRPKTPYVPAYLNVARKDHPYTDDWGCVWETTTDGITGTVTKHPLDDWSKFDTYPIPDPKKCTGIAAMDWEKERELVQRFKKEGRLTKKGLRHGHTYLQINDIRGYENVIFDMMDEEPRLRMLLDKIVEFNTYILEQYAAMGVDLLTYAEDLGMQHGPMISPDHFREYILPCYRRMLRPAKENDILVHMHSDGDIRTLAPMLMECGMDVLNLQDLVNGIHWIRQNMQGKVCIELDIDRQLITPYGSPEDVERLILDEVKTLGSRQGGLMLIYGLYPNVPLENVKALMDAMEKYAFYYC